MIGSNLFATAVDKNSSVGGESNVSVFLSTNNGSTWTRINNGLTSSNNGSLAVSGTNLFIAANGRVNLSINNGLTWTAINNGLSNSVVSTLAVNNTNLFAGTYTYEGSAGVFFSSNNGSSWNNVSNGLKTSIANSLVISGTDLFVGTEEGGVWRRPLSEIMTGIEDLQNNLLTSFLLHQNYPNPFNPTTTIEYQISKPSNVKINIYDITGRLIKELINDQKSIGKYSVVWNGKDNSGSTVASGNYFYQIISGDFAQVKKMILLK